MQLRTGIGFSFIRFVLFRWFFRLDMRFWAENVKNKLATRQPQSNQQSPAVELQELEKRCRGAVSSFSSFSASEWLAYG
jgi:hypothetical protein